MKIVLSLIISLSFSWGFSQNLNIFNQMNFGGANKESLGLLNSPIGDGYYFIGSSNSDISGNKSENSKGGYDIWILKTDLNFNILWDKTIGGSSDDNPTSVVFENDAIYILANSQSDSTGDKTMNRFGFSDLWLLCLDLNANILWQKQYGGNQYEYNSDLIDFSPSTFLIAVDSDSPISGNKTITPYGYNDIWLLEINKTNGQIVTQKNLGSNGSEDFPKLLKHSGNGHVYMGCQTSNGEISGNKTDSSYGSDDLWIVEIDENLTIVQDKVFGGSNMDNFPLMVEIDDYIYVSANSKSDVSGNKTSPAQNPAGLYSDGWLLKLDENLNLLWDKSYGGYAEEGLGKIHKNSNGNLILSLASNSIANGNKTSIRYGMSYDSWLVITDPNGNILAQESYGGTENDFGYFYAIPNNNQQLLLVGTSYSGISGNKTVPSNGQSDTWLATIDASNFLNTEILQGSQSTISVYPNPFVDHVNFDFGKLNEDVLLSIFSIDGKLISESLISKDVSSFKWMPSGDDPFLIYKLVGHNVQHTGKIVKN